MARRLRLTPAQLGKLDAAREALHESKQRIRAKVSERLPQLDELLQQHDASGSRLSELLHDGLVSLEREIAVLAGLAGEFLDSLDATQRRQLRDALRRRLSPAGR